MSLLSSQISESQTELEQNYDELRLTKVDLEASKELIAKLDVQRDKLYAELEESKTIRSQVSSIRRNEILEKNVPYFVHFSGSWKTKLKNFGIEWLTLIRVIDRIFAR